MFRLALSLAVGVAAYAPAADTDLPPAILDLYKSGKLFDKAQYKAVRAVFADRFARRHESDIHDAFGDDDADDHREDDQQGVGQARRASRAPGGPALRHRSK